MLPAWSPSSPATHQPPRDINFPHSAPRRAGLRGEFEARMRGGFHVQLLDHAAVHGGHPASLATACSQAARTARLLLELVPASGANTPMHGSPDPGWISVLPSEARLAVLHAFGPRNGQIFPRRCRRRSTIALPSPWRRAGQAEPGQQRAPRRGTWLGMQFFRQSLVPITSTASRAEAAAILSGPRTSPPGVSTIAQIRVWSGALSLRGLAPTVHVRRRTDLGTTTAAGPASATARRSSACTRSRPFTRSPARASRIRWSNTARPVPGQAVWRPERRRLKVEELSASAGTDWPSEGAPRWRPAGTARTDDDGKRGRRLGTSRRSETRRPAASSDPFGRRRLTVSDHRRLLTRQTPLAYRHAAVLYCRAPTSASLCQKAKSRPGRRCSSSDLEDAVAPDANRAARERSALYWLHEYGSRSWRSEWNGLESAWPPTTCGRWPRRAGRRSSPKVGSAADVHRVERALEASSARTTP